MIDLNERRALFAQYFSSGTNLEDSFAIKLEVLTLLSFLTQELGKRYPDEFKNAYDVLSKYVYKDAVLDTSSWVAYIESLSIICDDLLFGCNPIPKPDKYTSAIEVKNRIKEIIAEWLPF